MNKVNLYLNVSKMRLVEKIIKNKINSYYDEQKFKSRYIIA